MAADNSRGDGLTTIGVGKVRMVVLYNDWTYTIDPLNIVQLKLFNGVGRVQRDGELAMLMDGTGGKANMGRVRNWAL